MNPTPFKSNIYLAIAGAIVAMWVGLIIFGLVNLYLHARPAETGASQTREYSSQQESLHFSYSHRYTLTEREDSFNGAPIRVLTLIDASTTVPDMSEGPTAMSIIIVPIAEDIDLEAWVKDNSISNFYLSPDKVFTPTLLWGVVPAVAYRYSGLYEFDAVAAAYAGHMYLFSASWMDASDRIRGDFKDLLSSVTFTQ